MYEQIRASMFGKKLKKKWVDEFKEIDYVPLGMIDEIENYMYNKDEFTNSDDLVGFEIDKDNIFNCMIIASSGYGKNRLTKPMVNSFRKAGYKIIVFDAKSHEFLSANKRGSGRRLHPKQKNESMKVVGYVPSYVESELDEFSRDKFKIYSHNVSNFRTRESWSSLGMSSRSADWCVGQIEDGVSDINVLAMRLNADESLMGITKKSGQSAIESMIGTNFFNPHRRELDIKKHWDRDEVISISYFSKSGNLMETDVGQIIQQVKEIGANELKKGPEYVTPKLMVFDDAFYYLNSKTTKVGETNLAVQGALNIANNYRSFGMNMIIEVQNASLIDFRIIESSTHLIIGKVRNASSLRDLVPRNVFEILNSSGRENEPPPLKSDQRAFIREFILQQDDDYQRFYPFDCNVGH